MRLAVLVVGYRSVAHYLVQTKQASAVQQPAEDVAQQQPVEAQTDVAANMADPESTGVLSCKAMC